jgi:hypothetical protein
LYTFGPVQVTSGDPFGLFRVSRRFGERQPVLVYPRALDLPRFYVPPANLPGDTRFRRRTHTITPNAAGVRPYAEGDSFSRIHWLSTARTGQIMVKLFELDPASDIWIVLDLDRRSHYGEGDDGTEEQSVRIAASVARFFLNANRAVGFVAYGRDQHHEVDVAFDDEGTILGLRCMVYGDVGAYPDVPTALGMPTLTNWMSSGCYAIPALATAHKVVATNKSPLSSYRGAGPAPGAGRRGGG